MHSELTMKHYLILDSAGYVVGSAWADRIELHDGRTELYNGDPSVFVVCAWYGVKEMTPLLPTSPEAKA